MSLNLSINYSQPSAILTLEGLPDLSLNHEKDIIGILSSWKLTLVGSSELEGKLIHLKAMINVVLPYARYCLSNVKKDFGSLTSPVRISHFNTKHKISLISSQEGVAPLEIILDDAELSDLVRCLDSLRIDSRVKIDWQLPIDCPLKRRELSYQRPLFVLIGIPFIGISIGLITSLVLLMIPSNITEETLDDLVSTNLIGRIENS